METDEGNVTPEMLEELVELANEVCDGNSDTDS